MKSTVRTGAHIEGIHWVAEYLESTHEVRLLREGAEVGVYDAPPAFFGEEADAGSKNAADHRALEAALRAYLLRFVAEHDAEE
jgi:hypothetical protein